MAAETWRFSQRFMKEEVLAALDMKEYIVAYLSEHPGATMDSISFDPNEGEDAITIHVKGTKPARFIQED